MIEGLVYNIFLIFMMGSNKKAFHILNFNLIMSNGRYNTFFLTKYDLIN